MAFGRPLLYMSLPSVAFILGVFWFRRRNKNRFDGDMIKGSRNGDAENEYNSSNNKKETTTAIVNGSVKTNASPSKPININGTLPSDEENRVFGKSAPITIVQNGRGSSPIKASQKQFDSEVLKSKIQEAENKLLKSIDEDFENLSSPVDLPDSVNLNKRKSFYLRNVDIKKDEPVVIVATTTPKISPVNSFLESTYTKENEQNNNLQTSKSSECVIYESQAENKPITTSVNSPESEDKVKNDTATAVHVVNDSDVNDSESVTTVVNQKRDLNAPSPSTSLGSAESGDSGKGASLPRPEAAKTTYEFFLPNSLVGQLYGQKRSYVNFIKSRTNASVVLRKKMYDGKLRVCAVEGTEKEINSALYMIRQRLPGKRYPNLTMQRVHFVLPQTVVPLSTESLAKLHLNLIEGINNDVYVSSVISGGHIFVQQPLHPSHPSLSNLQKSLYDTYTTVDAPLLPSMEIGAFCVMPCNGAWYRVQIVGQDEVDPDRCIVKSLDFGGFINVHFNELRQMNVDFMNVPFQATECILSNIEPIETCWSAESAEVLLNLTKGFVLQAQVAGYNSANIPEIYLYACLGPNKFIFINRELEARNLAKWVDI